MQLSPRLLQEVRLGQRVHRERDRKLTFSGGHEFDWERSDKGFPAAAAQPAAATAVPAAFGSRTRPLTRRRGVTRAARENTETTLAIVSGAKIAVSDPFGKNH